MKIKHMMESISTSGNLEVRSGYKRTRLGWIPKNWLVQSLGEILDFKNGVNAEKESYGKGKKFINVMEVIKYNVITDSNIPGMVILSDSAFRQNQVKSGDILFNRTSETNDEIGITALYLGDEDVVFGGFVIRGRPKNAVLTNDFKKYGFSTSIVRKQIISKGQGAVRTNIGQKDLEKVYLAIPSKNEQQKIATVLSTWDKAIENLDLAH
ncbi:restriction endonuclease subunit S [Antarcticibacterium sp. 1MA-6-2]|uniref:restriction endonuclease subunit S n=1 Tax=Antarcticibacterium sp. 1MA-6-2 TaxID=2908210 RepID=UPI001F333E54|nr:restriction endonuclease subunit S [Antarcticibacterium sp. 1MA-6-2]UJH90561.1 restriction endonuclease subunit S [Antarcticibacterium sp. 1MA-6-2]